MRQLIVERARAEIGGNPADPGWSVAARLDPAALARQTVAAAERAIARLNQGGIVVMVDGRQITDLDAVIALRPTTRIEFLRLLPLKGG